MDAIGIGLLILGLLANSVCGIWIIIIAFQRHIGWGLAVLFVPIASLVYVCMDWNRAAKPFLINLVAVVMMVSGFFMSPTLQKAIAEGDRSGSILNKVR